MMNAQPHHFGNRRLAGFFLLVFGWSLVMTVSQQRAAAQGAVDVTMTLGSTNICVGDTTLLRVYGRIDPSIQPNSDRIFSWYIDVLNANGLVATADWNNLSTIFSDNNALTSDDGKIVGDDCLGVYDTFINRTSAGLTAPIELLRVNVTAVAVGQTTFTARAGTTVMNLAHDFLVAGTSGAGPFTGGDYGAASITLNVFGTFDQWLATYNVGGLTGPDDDFDCDGIPHLAEYAYGMDPTVSDVELAPKGSIVSGFMRVTINRPVLVKNLQYIVEISPDLTPASWTTTGTAVVINTATQYVVRESVPTAERYMRVRLVHGP